MYYIKAPQNGYINRTLQSGIGENIKEGVAIATIMPSKYDIAVESYVDPIDLPLIKKGEKVIEGDVDILLDPAHTVVEIDTTDNKTAAEKLQQTKWAAHLQKGKSLQLMMNKEEVPKMINELVALNIQLLSVNSSHSLEDYFLSLTTNSGYVEPFAN